MPMRSRVRSSSEGEALQYRRGGHEKTPLGFVVASERMTPRSKDNCWRALNATGARESRAGMGNVSGDAADPCKAMGQVSRNYRATVSEDESERAQGEVPRRAGIADSVEEISPALDGTSFIGELLSRSPG